MRRAAAVNILKAWLLFAIVAGVFGGFGWLLAGYRTASIFVFCAVLAGLAVYAYADRALLGMLGAREYALAEDPLLASTVARLAAKAGVMPPKLYVIADGFPRALSAGRGPRSSSLAVSTGLLGALPPAELDAVLAHELAHVRSRDVLVQTFAVSVRGHARRAEPDRRLARARPALRLRADRRGVRPSAPLASGGSSPRTASRPPCAARRTVSPMHCCASTRPASSSRSRRRPPPSRSTRSIRSRRPGSRACSSPIRRSPSGSAACATSIRSATACRPPERRKAALADGLFAGRNGRRPTLPGACAPSTIGAGGLNFSVRNGKRCIPAAMTAQLSRALRRSRTLKTP